MSGRSTTARGLTAVAAACLIGAVTESGASQTGSRELRVRASEAFAPCLAPALEAFTRETGVSATLEVRDPDPTAGADVVVGGDSELVRVLEGGTADLSTAFDLGSIPWVLVSPAGSPADMAAAMAGADRLTILGGRVGRDARGALGSRLPADGVRVSRDRDELRRARYAIVPRSLAGPGEQRSVGLPPLVVVAVAVRDAPNAADAQQLLAFLKTARGRAALSPCLAPSSEVGSKVAPGAAPLAETSTRYAASVVDWWIPQCSLEHDAYNDPNQALGPPDAVYLGSKDQYLGMMSLGQGGYVTVDMGVSAVDGTGADVRVYQTTANEPVTLYASTSARGPFTLVGLRLLCGVRTGGGVLSNHCDFDLHNAGLTEARYLKVEDGEVYPCLKGGTVSEGADIDAIQILNQKP